MPDPTALPTPDLTFEDVTGHRIECHWYPPQGPGRAIVLLHEGLGSASHWRDFPARLAARTGRGVLVPSRYGYGRSTPCPTPLGVTYMHREALQALPALLDARGLERPFLVGHSDGGSIALLCAGGTGRAFSGILTLAAHVMCEPICVEAIQGARITFDTTNLRDRLARYHDDPEGAFELWCQAWMHPDFAQWSIEDALPGVHCPVLALQGDRDQYGTIEQLHRIAAGVAGPVETRLIPDCGHSAPRDQPEAVLRAIMDFVVTVDPATSPSEAP